MSKLISKLFALILIVVCPTLVVGQTTFSIPDGVTVTGDTISIPIIINNDPSNALLGLSITTSFDSNILEFIGYERGDTISDSLTTVVNNVGSEVLLSMAGIHPLVESGTLIYLEFRAIEQGAAALSISKFRINENEIVTSDDISSTVFVFDSNSNNPPIALNLPDTIIVTVGDTLKFIIDESIIADPEDQFQDLIITAIIDPPLSISADYDSQTNIVSLFSNSFTGFVTLSLVVVDSNGGILEVDIVLDVRISISNEEESFVSAYKLSQNYPNPFNPSSTIDFYIPVSGEVNITIYNLLGQQIATLVDDKLNAGQHAVTFDASGLPSGTYIYSLTAGNFSEMKKMTLIK